MIPPTLFALFIGLILGNHADFLVQLETNRGPFKVKFIAYGEICALSY